MNASSSQASQDPLGLRRHPYRALFPLAWFMAWWTVTPWILFWAGTDIAYPRETHALIFIQGVLTTFAAGFLFTMLPRRLDGEAPAAWEMMLAVSVPLLHSVLVWTQFLAWAHALWSLEAFMLLAFTSRHIFARGGRSGPAAFLWIPFAFACGGVGSLSQAALHFWPTVIPAEVAYAGWLLLTQGMFLSLALGVGAMFVPLTTRMQSSGDVSAMDDAFRRRAGHALAALVVVCGFGMEAMGYAASGRLLRAAAVLATLLRSAHIHQLPTFPGTQRRLIWFASWCLPLGLALAGAWPALPQVGLHIFFLGGLVLLTFSVGLHVGLAHSSGKDLVLVPVPAIRCFGSLILAALACRLGAEFDGLNRYAWLASAAGFFLLSLLPWGWLILPRLLPDLWNHGKRKV